ncbi:SUKH-4 family immunity protein [Streptomyces sp. T-3]|nr:SUKH-4 family immunity protein [Streptomyces sp. T-3]
MNTHNDAVPHFSLVRLHVSAALPEEESLSLVVPAQSVGETYRACESLETIQSDGRGFVKFGLSGISGDMLIDLSSQRVVEMQGGASEPSLVNTSIERFQACVREFIEGFPFYETAEDEDDFESAAQKLEESICRLDPEAYFEGGYWYEIRWGIAIGDFATEDLV